jgi:hypothetical protein
MAGRRESKVVALPPAAVKLSVIAPLDMPPPSSLKASARQEGVE